MCPSLAYRNDHCSRFEVSELWLKATNQTNVALCVIKCQYYGRQWKITAEQLVRMCKTLIGT